MTRAKNDGQLQLVATQKSLRTIADVCGVAVTTARAWKTARARPREAQRKALRAAYDIPLDAWDTPSDAELVGVRTGKGRPSKREATQKPKRARKKPPAPAVRVVPPYPDAPSDASIVLNLWHSLACIRHDLQHGDVTTSARSKLRGDEARTLGLIAKLQREEELSEDRYVKNHPAFKEHCERVLAALKPFPDAARAVLDALRDPQRS